MLDRELDIRATLLYIKHHHTLNQGNPKSRMELTPFHSALTSGDEDMVNTILNSLQDPQLIFQLVNTPLVSLEQQQERTNHVPPKVIYLSCILHLLTPQDRRQISEEMAYLIDLPASTTTASWMESGLYFEVPLVQACCSGNTSLIYTMLTQGAELTACDSRSENVIHSLVRLSKLAPQRAVEMYSVLMNDICDAETRHTFLRGSNLDGKLPIDLAAKLGLPEMLKVIVNTEGVYKFSLIDYGLIEVVRYDITDYESQESKIHKSLLYYLTDFDEHQLERAQKCQLLSSEPFDTWIKTKFNSKKGLMWTFIIYWFILIISFGFSLQQYATVGCINPLFLIVNFLMAFAYLAVEISHSKTNLREIWMSLKGVFIRGHVPVTFTFAYRFFQIIFAALVIFSAVLYPLQCTEPDFILVAYIITGLFGSLSLLFFVQLQSHVGHLLIILQKIVFDTLFFFFMMVLVYIAFALSLFLLHIDVYSAECKKNNNTNWKLSSDRIERCRNATDSFPNNFWEALYETILLMFSVMAPRDILFTCARLPGLAVLLYLLLLIIISIVLVNLLIAIMTKRIDEISRMKDDILKLERVSIILYMEERIKTRIAILGFQYWDRLINYMYSKVKCCRRSQTDQGRNKFYKTPGDNMYLYIADHTIVEQVS